jgi:hypothetical protein
MKELFQSCIFSFLISLSLNGQAGQQGLHYSKIPEGSGEEISLFTDRKIYCVNEKICFTAEYSCIDELDTLSWSNVLYVELIRWNGNKFARMKLKLVRPATSGSVEIPGNMPSGNYYLRAYTKWMRNYSPLDYAYLPVKIVNPFRSDTDEGPAEKQAGSETVTLNPSQKMLINGVSCTPVKNEFKPLEKAEVGIQINNMKLTSFDRYCISVVKAGAIDTAISSYLPGSTSAGNTIQDIEYLPEIRGITISGEIIDNSTGLPAKEANVSLSETMHGEHFAVNLTDGRGRFVFALPDMQGQRDFFIQVETPSEILIDYGFCSKPVQLPYVSFSLTKDEADLAREMVVSQQISERYLTHKDTLTGSQPGKPEPLVFYGSRKSVYPTEKYIELPNIEEFVNEIVMEATILNERGKPSFISMSRTDYAYHRPLILMDNIQVNNDERLLKTPLNRIERVEAVNMDYIAGGEVFNGIISFYSRNKDLAGLDLNKNGMFFTYDLYSDTDQDNDFQSRPFDPRVPDRRNLLYWNPDIHLSPDEKTTISFFTSDCTGDYVVYIRGKNSPDDREIYGKCYFSVR